MPDSPDPSARTKPGAPRPASRRLGVWIVLGIALAVGLGVFYDKAVKDNLFPRNFGVVEAGEVYRSGRLTPAALRTLHDRYGLRTVVDLGAYEPGSREDDLAQRTADALGITRVRLPRLEGDATGDPDSYVEALRLLADQRTHPILVHCAAGSERTSACMMLYREIIQGQDPQVARDEALAHKHDPKDNPKLEAFLTRWQGAIERAFLTGGKVVPPPTPEQTPAEAATAG